MNEDQIIALVRQHMANAPLNLSEEAVARFAARMFTIGYNTGREDAGRELVTNLEAVRDAWRGL